MYWDKHGIEGICVRIGTAIEKPTEFRHLSTWLGNDDLVQLMQRCITVPGYRLSRGLGRFGQYAQLLEQRRGGAAGLPADAECRGLRGGDSGPAESAGCGGAALSGRRLCQHRLHAAGATAAAFGRLERFHPEWNLSSRGNDRVFGQFQSQWKRSSSTLRILRREAVRLPAGRAGSAGIARLPGRARQMPKCSRCRPGVPDGPPALARAQPELVLAQAP